MDWNGVLQSIMGNTMLHRSILHKSDSSEPSVLTIPPNTVEAICTSFTLTYQDKLSKVPRWLNFRNGYPIRASRTLQCLFQLLRIPLFKRIGFLEIDNEFFALLDSGVITALKETGWLKVSGVKSMVGLTSVSFSPIGFLMSNMASKCTIMRKTDVSAISRPGQTPHLKPKLTSLRSRAGDF